MSTPTRTSRRTRQPSRKYTVDAFEGLDISDEDGNNNASNNPVLRNGAVEDDDDDDEDFEADPTHSPGLEGEELDEDEDGDEFIEPEYDRDGEEYDFSAAPSGVEGTRVKGGIKPLPALKKRKRARGTADVRFQPRGLLEPTSRGSKQVHRLFMLGPGIEEQRPAMQAHYKWANESTVPSRTPNASGFGGFKRSFYHTDKQREREAAEGWHWYDSEGGKEAFEHCQQAQQRTAMEAQTYMPATAEPCRLVMGPYKHQTLRELPVASPLDLNEPWRAPAPDTNGNPAPQPPKERRHGWLLNVGDRVQAMEWLPNQTGSIQFLALSCLSLETLTSDHLNRPASAPAFTPQKPTKSSIQIWEFAADADGHISTEQTPRLRKVICTAWGDVMAFKWCPMPRNPEEPAVNATETHLGLLAGIWGDGSMRVLDISLPAFSDAPCNYEHISTAAFSTRPPHTVCTCLVWLNTSSIAVGCANGCIGIWNIAPFLSTPSHPSPITPTHSTSPPPTPEPTIYLSVSTTYILAITTCYPSRPHILLSTSMAGHLHLTDLPSLSTASPTSPATTIRSSRTRMGRALLVWHDYSQTAISADDNHTLCAYPLRRFYRQTSVTRMKSAPACVAVSPVHPFVMTACVGGEVACSNPLRRAFETKVPIWNQVWFTHEWRAVKAGERLMKRAAAGSDAGVGDADTAMRDDDNEHTVTSSNGGGLVRMLEGFRPEQVRLFNTPDSMPNRVDGTVYSTVYEMKTSVTVVCWNPNVHVGGWVAAGMASGLVRVEDVAC